MSDNVFVDTNILVYSEDLQDSQQIENQITVMNPFKQSANKR
jgi:predicted nucleic acid-binding protein